MIDYLRRKKIADNYLFFPLRDFKGQEEKYRDKFCECTDNPEEALIKDENGVILRKFVSGLKPAFRVLVELRYFGQYSYSEIASELKLPVGTVKVQLFRSRKELLQLLKKSEIGYI